MSQRLRAMRRVGGVVAIGVCASLMACGGGGAAGDESADTTEQPSTTEPPTTTTTVDPDAQALADAEAAYLAYEEARTTASAHPVNPQHPDLQAVITGDHRIHTNSELGGNLARGEAVRLAEPSEYRVEVLSGSPQTDGSILLRVCRVDDRIVYDVATGEIVDDDAVTKTVDAVMLNEGGAWKVSHTTLVAETEGVARCTG